MPSLRLFLAGLTLCTALSFSESSEANGLVTHVYLTDQAVEQLPPGPLRTLMQDSAARDAYRNGAVYPDTGYAASHEYGEWSHWEPFVQGFITLLRERYQGRYETPEAQRLVAFLMGVGSHVMADQVFDTLFMARTRERDGTDAELDNSSDGWLVVEHNETRTISEMIPLAEIQEVYRRVPGGPSPTEMQIRFGVSRVATGMRAVNTLSWTWYDQRWHEYPWSASHYMDERTPGSFPFVARAVSRYMTMLWARLTTGLAPTDSVIFTYPNDGAVNVPIDAQSTVSRLQVQFGIGLDTATANSNTVRLFRADGTRVQGNVTVYSNTSNGNTLRLAPRENLSYDTQYRLELAPTLRFITGDTLGTAFSFSFRTRCAPGQESACPALVPEAPTLSTPPVRNPRPPTTDAGRPFDASISTPDAQSPATTADSAAPMDGGTPPSSTGCSCSTSTQTSRATGFYAILFALFVHRATQRKRQRSTETPGVGA